MRAPNNQSLLIPTLLTARYTDDFSEIDWETCIRQARSARLLPRLAVGLWNDEHLQRIPAAVTRHLNAAIEEQRHLRQATVNEINHLLDAFEGSGITPIFLKGAAYEAADLKPAQCRLFNDIDLLVPRERISEAETLLMMHGWASTPHDAYDDEYYRRWMHEIPPLRHISRHSVIDLHHTIVPLTAGLRLDPAQLFTSAVPCPEFPGAYVLAPFDRILHSAVHLFHDGEFDHGLRDLFDIADLLSESIQDDGDWPSLIQRANELDLVSPLGLALRYVHLVLGYPVPPAELDRIYRNGHSRFSTLIDDQLFLRGLLPDHPSCNDALTPLARSLLYLRGHALRMPLKLLLPHLIRKGIKRIREEYFTPTEARPIDNK